MYKIVHMLTLLRTSLIIGCLTDEWLVPTDLELISPKMLSVRHQSSHLPQPVQSQLYADRLNSLNTEPYVIHFIVEQQLQALGQWLKSRRGCVSSCTKRGCVSCCVPFSEPSQVLPSQRLIHLTLTALLIPQMRGGERTRVKEELEQTQEEFELNRLGEDLVATIEEECV